MQLGASVYGLGGVTIIDGIVVSWFAPPISSADERFHGHKRGDDKGQQVWEALCLLIALRVWASFGTGKKLNMTLKSDNMAALVLIARMKSNASPPIAKEVAYAMSRAAFQPRLIVHVPGVMNFVADSLSCLSSPDGSYSVPASLDPSLRASTPQRTEAYYSTLRPNASLGGRSF